MCPNICNIYRKFNFAILSLLILNFSINLQAQVAGTLSVAAIAQRNAVIGQVSAGAKQAGSIASFKNFVIATPTPAAITPALAGTPMLNDSTFWSPQTIVGAGIFFESIKKITATNFVPSLSYLGANGDLAATEALKTFVASKYTAFIAANPVLAPLASISTIVNANSTYPGLSLDSVSGLVNKTTAYCAALEGATFSWQGATCTNDSQCCDGQVCIIDSTINLGVASDGTTSYGACDTPPCVEQGIACKGTGTGNCCQMPVALVCDTSVCKLPVGATCTPGAKECVTGTQCDASAKTCKIMAGNSCYPTGSSVNCITGTVCNTTNNTCQCANPVSCTAGTCCTGSLCDIKSGASSGACVAAGKNLIPTGDSGCKIGTDCVSGSCSAGICQCAMSTSGCTTDSDCCVGTGSCDLTTSQCVLNKVGIPGSTYDAQGNLTKNGDDCYSDGVTPIGGTVYPASVCVAGQTCQASESGVAVNFCQLCGTPTNGIGCYPGGANSICCSGMCDGNTGYCQ